MRGRPPKSPVIPSRKIWVDAGALARDTIDQLLKVAHERRVILTLVSDQAQAHSYGHSPYIRSMVVATEFGTAPVRIAAMLDQGDLVVTADAALTASAGQKKAKTLSPGNGRKSASKSTAPAAVTDRLIELLAQP